VPTYLDKDGVVHDVDVSTGAIRSRCKSTPSEHHPPETARIDLHANRSVTCFMCLAEGPNKDPTPEFAVCDTCSSWWQERDEKLINVTDEEVAGHENFRVFKVGTMPTCANCRP